MAQQQMAAQQAAAQQAAAAPAGGLTDEAIAQLQKLAELQKAGIITQEEFDAKKKQILGM
jgi:hypothetical protein